MMSLLSGSAALGRIAEQKVRLRCAAARMLSVLRRSSCAPAMLRMLAAGVFLSACVRKMVLREAECTDCDVVAVWVCGGGGESLSSS